MSIKYISFLRWGTKIWNSHSLSDGELAASSIYTFWLLSLSFSKMTLESALHKKLPLTCHGEDADEDPDVPAGQHDLLTVLLLPRPGPPGGIEPDGQDEHVEDDHPDQPRHTQGRRLQAPGGGNI